MLQLVSSNIPSSISVCSSISSSFLLFISFLSTTLLPYRTSAAPITGTVTVRRRFSSAQPDDFKRTRDGKKLSAMCLGQSRTGLPLMVEKFWNVVN